MLNKEELKKEAKKFVYARIDKEKADYILKVARLARDSFRNFLTGQAKEAVILGSLCAIGMIILNIPYAGPIGALTAITAFIPIVGAFIGGGLFGIMGMIVGLPIVSIIYAITQENTNKKLQEKNLEDKFESQ